MVGTIFYLGCVSQSNKNKNIAIYCYFYKSIIGQGAYEHELFTKVCVAIISDKSLFLDKFEID